MLDVRKLRLLRELGRRGTIAAVAEALSYTPSAVSQQLSGLERDAGVRLLDRTGRRVVLTPAAWALVEHTEAILEILERAQGELSTSSAQLRGPLRIAVFPSAVSVILTPVLVSLSSDHPDLELMMSELDPSAMAAALLDETADIALLQEYDHVPVAPGDALTTEPLMQETVHLVGSDHGRIADCRDSDWIAGTPGTLCHTLTIRVCESAGFTPRIRHHADDFGTVMALSAAGQGVALVPDLGLPHPPCGVAVTALDLHRRTHLAFRRGTSQHPAIAAARRALHAAVAGTPMAPAEHTAT